MKHINPNHVDFFKVATFIPIENPCKPTRLCWKTKRMTKLKNQYSAGWKVSGEGFDE